MTKTAEAVGGTKRFTGSLHSRGSRVLFILGWVTSQLRRGQWRPIAVKVTTRLIGTEGQTPSTRWVFSSYCCGIGLEIGPGRRPYGPRPQTIALDRFYECNGYETNVDVLGDAGSLPFADNALDYLISSHVLEHYHDVISALAEWGRVVRPGGTIVLILPHVDRTFDHGRPVANLNHHLAEVGKQIDLDNPDHFADNEKWTYRQGGEGAHPWQNEPGARHADGSWNRRWIAQHAYIHYHCWTQKEMVEIVQHMGWNLRVVLEQMPDRYDSFMVVARLPSRQLSSTTKPRAGRSLTAPMVVKH